MGKIIAFPAETRRIAGARTPPPEGEAQILFFLGVRYSRLDDDERARSARNRRGRDMGRGGKRKQGA
jgi:hypothetical protein